MAKRFAGPPVTHAGAVGVRIAVPPDGFGSQWEAMQFWLEQHVGRGRFALPVEPCRSQTLVFSFADQSAAQAFVNRFVCGVATDHLEEAAVLSATRS